MAGVIDDFINGWPREIHFWSVLAEAAMAVCKEGIQDSLQVKCHLTCRAKSQASLRQSIERRQMSRGVKYTNRKEIEEDMIDLAGVRVTLAFPGDVEEVKSFLSTRFGDVEQRFWGLDEKGNAVERKEKGRFIGYRATHFLVKWKTPIEGPHWNTTPVHQGMTIEIQVTSLIMNAWQEAHHDLVYKHLSGDPSEDEKDLIEAINGIAHAGEVALSQLQRCVKRRINTQNREFMDEYEVAAWMKANLPELLHTHTLGFVPTLQRLAVLYDLLQIFHLNTPASLRAALVTEVKVPVPTIPLAEDYQKALRADEHVCNWTQMFKNDGTSWAIMKICIPRCNWEYLYVESYEPKARSRLKAFACINSINFALSETPRLRWIHELVHEILVEHRGIHGKIVQSLHSFSLSGFSMTDQEIAEYSHCVNIFWHNFLKAALERNSSFLRMALALSFSGIAAINQGFVGYGKVDIWWPPSTAPHIFSIGRSPDQKYLIQGNKWRRVQVSLFDIVYGNGWNIQSGSSVVDRMLPAPSFESECSERDPAGIGGLDYTPFNAFIQVRFPSPIASLDDTVQPYLPTTEEMDPTAARPLLR